MAHRPLIGTALACLLFAPTLLHAQSIEVSPFIGTRVGSDVFDVTFPTVHVSTVEHAPAVGVTLNVPIGDGRHIEGEFSHEPISVVAFPDPTGAATHFQGAIDHWQAGELQEYFDGPARPFLTGVVGLTRFAIAGDAEYRFSVGAGGGVKLFPSSRLGVRLDGRLFAMFLDASTHGGVCGGNGCLLGLNLDVEWQLEFTAAVVVRLGAARTSTREDR